MTEKPGRRSGWGEVVGDEWGVEPVGGGRKRRGSSYLSYFRAP